MNNIPDDVIANPPTDWVKNLRRDNKIYLVKEKQYAFIDFAYDGHRIGLSTRPSFGYESWFVRVDGCGNNGSLLMLPVKNCFSDHPPNIDQSEVDQLRIELEVLRDKINRISRLPQIAKELIHQDFDEQLFGLIPGYCENCTDTIPSTENKNSIKIRRFKIIDCTDPSFVKLPEFEIANKGK